MSSETPHTDASENPTEGTPTSSSGVRRFGRTKIRKTLWLLLLVNVVVGLTGFTLYRAANRLKWDIERAGGTMSISYSNPSLPAPLRRFSGRKGIQSTSIMLDNTRVDDDWLCAHPELRDQPGLTLYLRETNVGDAGLAALAEAKDLRMLTLDKTRITDDGLSHLAGMETLSCLHLQGTNIGDEGLRHVSRLPKVSSLELSGTKVTDAGFRHIAKFRLSYLTLNNTDTGDEICSLLTAEPNRLHYYGGGKRFTGAGLKQLTVCPELKYLDLRGTQVRGVDLDALSTCANLKYLWLGSEFIGDEELKHLQGCSMLETVHLQGTTFSDEGMNHLGGSLQLTHIWLQGTRVTEKGLQILFRNQPRLETVAYTHSTITDNFVAVLTQNRSLTALILEDGTISDESVRHLCEKKQLRSLRLERTPVTDAALERLDHQLNLRSLFLSGTNITDAGLEQIKKVPTLERVRLLNTRFSREGVERLKKALPEAEIYSSPNP